MAATTKKAAATKKAADKKSEAVGKKAEPTSVAEVPDEPFFVESEGPTGAEITNLPPDPAFDPDHPGYDGITTDSNDRDAYTLRTPQDDNPDDRPYKQ